MVIEVTEAGDIEVCKAIEILEITEFLESLGASAKPQIDTFIKEHNKKFFFVNKSTNFLSLLISIKFFRRDFWHVKIVNKSTSSDSKFFNL